MPATLNEFSLDQITKAKYGLQTQTYTWGPATLATGENQIFEVDSWNIHSQVAVAVFLEAIAATQTAGVQVYWTADGLQSDRAQGWTSGYPADLRWYPTFAVAGSKIALYVNNTTGAAINNYQLNYVVTVATLNTLQRLLYGFGYTDADYAAIDKQQQEEKDIQTKINNLLSIGYRPFSFGSMFQNLFANRRISNPYNAVPFKVIIPNGATASTPKSISVGNPSNATNQVFVLKGVSFEGAPAINIVVNRDGDSALINQLNAPAFVQADDHPWPFFVPARNYYALTVNGSPGTYYLRLDIEQYQASQLLLAHLNMGVDITQVDIGLQ